MSSIQLQPSYPEYIFPDGSPYAGTQIAVDVVPILPPYYSLDLLKLTPEGYEQNMWISVTSPIVEELQQSDIDAAGGVLPYILSQAPAIVSATNIFYSADPPPASWVSPYVVPEIFSFRLAFANLATFFSTYWGTPTMTQKFYDLIVVLRNQIIQAMPMNDLLWMQKTYYLTLVGQNDATTIASLTAQDITNKAGLPVG